MAAGEKSVLTDNPTWIIDPIDGTTNFVHRYERVLAPRGPFECSIPEHAHFRESCNL